MYRSLVFALVCLISTIKAISNYPNSCPDQIYCNGNILMDLSKEFDDIKEFITFYNLNVTRAEAKSIYDTGNLKEFLKQFKDCSKNDCEDSWKPTDLSNNSPFNLNEEHYNEWAAELYSKWKDFGFKTSSFSYNESSLISVPYGYIVPNGKNREFQYSDSYWIMKGLLASKMGDTIQGMIDNFFYLLKSNPFVPMGNGVFLMERTQLPMLISMIELINKKPSQDQLLLLDKEMNLFLTYRQVHIIKNQTKYTLYHYNSHANKPRAEFYNSDIKTKNYNNLTAASESGWLLSSRWDIRGVQSAIKIVPVDLNAIIEKNFRMMATWYQSIDKKKSSKYDDLAKNLRTAINQILWNDQDGIWYDYDLVQNKQRNDFYISNFFPIWTKSYEPNERATITNHIMNYINRMAILRFPVGIPVSLKSSNYIWDYPNIWPTTMAYLIEGLTQLDTPQATQVAIELAKKWLNSCYKGYKSDQIMYGSYYALESGAPGYNTDSNTPSSVTSGIALHLLNTFGNAVLPLI